MSTLALVRHAEPVSAPTINADLNSPTAPIHGLGAKPSEVDYEITGPDGAPVIAVLGGISASKHVTSSPTDLRDGWWQTVVGAQRAIDTRKFRVISIDYLAHTVGQQPVTTEDQAVALAEAPIQVRNRKRQRLHRRAPCGRGDKGYSTPAAADCAARSEERLSS